MKLVGITAYGINVRNEANRKFRIARYIWSIPLEYFYGIANTLVMNMQKIWYWRMCLHIMLLIWKQ